MISKELLENVLNIKIRCFRDNSWLKTNDNIVFLYEFEQNEDFISIYELAFKCKEWAFNNGGYVIESRSYNQKRYRWEKEAFSYIHLPISGMGKQYWANTEVEAIFKACEWILNENNIKSN